jgi:hypothetical protein
LDLFSSFIGEAYNDIARLNIPFQLKKTNNAGFIGGGYRDPIREWDSKATYISRNA